MKGRNVGAEVGDPWGGGGGVERLLGLSFGLSRKAGHPGKSRKNDFSRGAPSADSSLIDLPGGWDNYCPVSG